MKKYTVTTPDELRSLCIRKNWFTSGTTRQYEKMFYANEHGCPIEEIATIIWLCSNDEDGCVQTMKNGAEGIFLKNLKRNMKNI